MSSQHSDEVVRRARLIYSRGYSVRETRMHLADEGVEVDPTTLERWVKWLSRPEAGGVDKLAR